MNQSENEGRYGKLADPLALARVYAPIGLDLVGPAPEKIAVSILAEFIAERRGSKAACRS